MRLSITPVSGSSSGNTGCSPETESAVGVGVELAPGVAVAPTGVAVVVGVLVGLEVGAGVAVGVTVGAGVGVGVDSGPPMTAQLAISGELSRRQVPVSW